MVVLAGLVHASFEDWLFAVGSYPCLFFWVFAFVLADILPDAAVVPAAGGVSRASRSVPAGFRSRRTQPMIRLFINGLAASAGGGLTYLRNVIPHLARRADAETTVLLNPAIRGEFGSFPTFLLSKPLKAREQSGVSFGSRRRCRT